MKTAASKLMYFYAVALVEVIIVGILSWSVSGTWWAVMLMPLLGIGVIWLTRKYLHPFPKYRLKYDDYGLPGELAIQIVLAYFFGVVIMTVIDASLDDDIKFITYRFIYSLPLLLLVLVLFTIYYDYKRVKHLNNSA